METLIPVLAQIIIGPLRARALLLLLAAWSMLAVSPTAAQQFDSDNQWVAPHDVSTLVLTLGQEHSVAMAVAALLPETEFKLGVRNRRQAVAAAVERKILSG